MWVLWTCPPPSPRSPLPHPVMTSPLHWSPSVSQAQRGRQPRTRAGATCAFLDLSQNGKVLSWGLSDHQWQVLSMCWGGPLHTGRRRAWPEDGPTPAPGPENGLHEPRRPPGQGGPGSRGGSSSVPQRRTAAGLGSWGTPRPLELLPERPQSRVGNQGTGGWPVPVRSAPQTWHQSNHRVQGTCTTVQHLLRLPVEDLPPQPLGCRFSFYLQVFQLPIHTPGIRFQLAPRDPAGHRSCCVRWRVLTKAITHIH